MAGVRPTAGRRHLVALLAVPGLLAAFAGAADAHGFMPDRSYMANGFFHVISAWHLLVPVGATGLALAEARRRTAMIAAGLGLMALIGGLMAARLMPPASLDFLVPLLFLAAGAGLIASPGGRDPILFSSAPLVGLLVGVSLYFDAPDNALWPWFAAGAIKTLVPIAAACFMAWRLIRRPSIAVGLQIVGSWLIAIALMLAGLSVRTLMEAQSLGISG